MRRAILVGRVAASIATIAAITLVYSQILPVNPTTVALTYVVGVLLLATAWGIAEATAAALTSVVFFNFFFLPPVGTLTIADPQNWVALMAFLVTAIVASQLSGRARRREIDATERRRDLERLYSLSRALLLAQSGASLPATIARQIAEAFDLPAVALYDREADTVSWGGAKELPPIQGKLRDVARQGMSIVDPSGMVVTAIQLGGVPIGSLAMLDAHLSDTVLQSIANLAAIGLERSRGQEAAARADAARRSGELRATVLDALAHEFKTPLTSMKAATSDLLTAGPLAGREQELVSIVDEDLDRLQALVSDAVQMLRIDAGDFVVRHERIGVLDVVSATLRRFEARLHGHAIIKRVPEGLTVDADRDLLALALRQLLDNAVKYSPPTSTIEVEATSNGSVTISVANSGPPIPERERERIVERFYRGDQARQIPGTGMGLAIVQQIARAHNGSLTVTSPSGTGAAFTLSFPKSELTA